HGALCGFRRRRALQNPAPTPAAGWQEDNHDASAYLPRKYLQLAGETILALEARGCRMRTFVRAFQRRRRRRSRTADSAIDRAIATIAASRQLPFRLMQEPRANCFSQESGRRASRRGLHLRCAKMKGWRRKRKEVASRRRRLPRRCLAKRQYDIAGEAAGPEESAAMFRERAWRTTSFRSPWRDRLRRRPRE